jgi:hypothetical protein
MLALADQVNAVVGFNVEKDATPRDFGALGIDRDGLPRNGRCDM